MGISDLFGFGKKEKKPFKIPREVLELRTRIQNEERENYPNLARYQEIIKEAEHAYELLNAIIVKKEHAEEAFRIKDDIRKKIEGLSAKVKRNIHEAKKEGKQDFVAKNIDYLERKSVRNNAKTLFTEFLDEIESIMKLCTEGASERGETMDSVTVALEKTISKLNTNFFKPHGGDMEIQGLKENAIRKLSDLSSLLQENKACFAEQGMEANTRKIARLAQQLSES